MKHVLLLALACLYTTPAFSSPVFQNPTLFATDWAPLIVAQSGGGTLTDSDLRRINFYANRAMATMIAFEDTNDVAALQALRTNIDRLIEAGEKSGLNIQNTADYFQEYIAQNGSGEIPEHFLTPAGQVETRALLQEIASFMAQTLPDPVDIEAIENADLLAIQSINAPAPQIEPDQQTQSQALVLPEIAPNADPEIRAIQQRIKVQDGQWVIEVAPGDSLGQYAEAIYNDQLLFRTIFDANRPVLVSPDVLPVGVVLVLPQVE